MSRIKSIWLYRLSLPLPVPYKVSNLVFDAFEPILVRVETSTGAQGWAETVVGPGYTDETDEGAWTFCVDMSGQLLEQRTEDAKAKLAAHLVLHSHAASVLISAIEMAEGNALLKRESAAQVPLLLPLQKQNLDEIQDEVDDLIEQGFSTFKVKIGFDVEDDLTRIARIQEAVRGRARLRLDANQAYSVTQAKHFLSQVDPIGIELLEQPCDKNDWDANAQVANGSRLPIMLDESIYTLEDVERAATLEGVKFVKVKINKLGGVQRLGDTLESIQRTGLRAVLGNGVATDISCWMEAVVGSHRIDTTGEMNGWLKLPQSLFRNPLTVVQGSIHIPAGYWPEIDEEAIARYTVARHVASSLSSFIS